SLRASGSTATAATPCSAISSSAACAQSSALRRPVRSGLDSLLAAAAGGFSVALLAGLAMSIVVHTLPSGKVSSPITRCVDKSGRPHHTRPYGVASRLVARARTTIPYLETSDERRHSLPRTAACQRVRGLPPLPPRDLGRDQRHPSGRQLVPRRRSHRDGRRRRHPGAGGGAAAAPLRAQAADHRAGTWVPAPGAAAALTDRAHRAGNRFGRLRG